MVFCTDIWMGSGLESRCVGRVCGADGAVRMQSQGNIPNISNYFNTDTHV